MLEFRLKAKETTVQLSILEAKMDNNQDLLNSYMKSIDEAIERMKNKSEKIHNKL